MTVRRIVRFISRLFPSFAAVRSADAIVTAQKPAGTSVTT